MSTKKKAAESPPLTPPQTRAEVPVTAAMLKGVRDELSERMSASDKRTQAGFAEAKADRNSIRSELKALERTTKAGFAEAKADRESIKADVQELKADVQELKADVQELKADVQELKAGIHDIKAQVHHIGVLVEEQNARNAVVLEHLGMLFQRQTRVEQEVEEVQETVRSLASARR